MSQQMIEVENEYNDKVIAYFTKKYQAEPDTLQPEPVLTAETSQHTNQITIKDVMIMLQNIHIRQQYMIEEICNIKREVNKHNLILERFFDNFDSLDNIPEKQSWWKSLFNSNSN